MLQWILVGVGGALGSLARHAINRVFLRHVGSVAAVPTAIVNIAGCAIIGVLAGLIAAGRLHMSLPMRTFVFVGVLGGFTTFSTFGLDTFLLTHTHAVRHAVLNVAVQVVVGVVAVWAGYRAAQW
jgi:CrcB protein